MEEGKCIFGTVDTWLIWVRGGRGERLIGLVIWLQYWLLFHPLPATPCKNLNAQLWVGK